MKEENLSNIKVYVVVRYFNNKVIALILSIIFHLLPHFLVSVVNFLTSRNNYLITENQTHPRSD